MESKTLYNTLAVLSGQFPGYANKIKINYSDAVKAFYNIYSCCSFEQTTDEIPSISSKIVTFKISTNTISYSEDPMDGDICETKYMTISKINNIIYTTALKSKKATWMGVDLTDDQLIQQLGL